MLLQASSAAGGADVLVSDILPQLLPLFTCAAAQRKLYGCSEPAAPDARAGAATSLASGECAGQSMQQRMRQALNIASHSVPGVLPPLRLMEGLVTRAMGSRAWHLDQNSHCSEKQLESLKVTNCGLKRVA